MKKTDVIDVLESLPEEIELDDLLRRLYLKAKLDEAEEDVAAGRIVEHDELVQRSEAWFE